MVSAKTRPCPNCGQPQDVNQTRCTQCGVQLTVVMNLSQVEPSLRIVTDGGQQSVFTLHQADSTLGSDPACEVVLKPPTLAPRMARIRREEGLYSLYDLTNYPGDVLLNGKFVERETLHDGDEIRLQDAYGRGVTLTFINPLERAGKVESQPQFYPLENLPFLIGRDPKASLVINSLAVSWHHAELVAEGNFHLLRDLKSKNGVYVNNRLITKEIRLQNEDVIRIDQVLLVYRDKGLERVALRSIQSFQISGIDLGVTFRSGWPRPRELNIMRDASLAILPREFVAIIGGSGSGKSTLLRALNGSRPPTEGRVLINEDNLYENYALYEQLFGYVPQQDVVQDKLTIHEALLFGARLRFPNEPLISCRQRVQAVLETLELTPYQDRLIGNLSGGQRKRVSIGIELLAEPRLLFMDEPSSGLDPGLDRSMMEMLRRLANRGQTVVVVTHTTLNIGICDKMAVIAKGNLTYFGPPKEALNFFMVRDYAEIYNRVAVSPDPDPAKRIGAEEAAVRWSLRYEETPLYVQHVLEPIEQAARLDSGLAERFLANKRLKRSQDGTFAQQTRTLIARNWVIARRDFKTLLALIVVLPLVGLFLGAINRDNLGGGRGQMLVDRFAGQDAEAFLIENLPRKPIPPEALVISEEGGPPSQNVRAVGVFNPANEAQRLLFMLALAVVLLGIFVTAYTITEERSMYLRERIANLRLSPYLTAKIAVYGGLALLSCLITLGALGLGVRYPHQGLLLAGQAELFITLALTVCAGASLGLLISALNKQINAVTYTVLAVLFFQILFAGILFPMNGALEVPSRLTLTRWAVEALGATSDITSRDAEGRFVIEEGPPINPRTGQPIRGPVPQPYLTPAPPTLELSYPTTVGGLVLRWGVLGGFSLFFLLGAGFVLRRNEDF